MSATAEVPGNPPRGVPDREAARHWCRARRIEDIECVVPDQAGVARGKMMPVQKFLGGTR